MCERKFLSPIRWRATYQKTGLPDVVLEGKEEATFAEGLIVKLEDSLDAGAAELFQSWTEEDGAELTKP